MGQLPEKTNEDAKIERSYLETDVLMNSTRRSGLLHSEND
jgi:hypothetical protein